jgi:hypothetical protein
MPSIVTNKFRIHNAEQFVEAFDEAANTTIFLTIGKNVAFPDDNNPPTPVLSVANTEYTIWRDMFAAKRITPADVTHAIDRVDWTSGTIYTQYDDQNVNLILGQYYVVTDDFNVYKCLFNNNNGFSTIKPTGTGTTVFTTADNYIWKYMYTVSTTRALKFLTSDYIPVQTLIVDDGSAQWTVQQSAVDGAISVVLVTNGGTNYFSGNTTVTITGDGIGATATAVVPVGPGPITRINVTSPGSGYTTATISISGAGSSATARAVISPKGGHGHNATEELNGKYVMLNTRLDGNEANTFSTSNEFRQVTLLRDPLIYGSSDRQFAAVARQTYRYTLSDVSGTFGVDGTVSDGANTATIVEWDATNSNLFTTIPLNQEFANGAVLTQSSTGATGTISAINSPAFEPYTGDVIYVENRVPIGRSADQIEDVKLIIQF